MEDTPLWSALCVLAVDPVSVGGLWLRGRAGPVRQRLTEALAALPLPLPLQKLSPNIGDDALYASLDTAATLRMGRAILRQGLLDKASVLVLPMAERCQPGLSARIAQAMDDQSTPARDLAALSRRQLEIGREIEAIVVSEDEDHSVVVSADDEVWDGTGY